MNSLSKAYDILLAGTVGSTSLQLLIEKALQPHRDTPERFKLKGPTLNINARMAMPLALILHELATNAAKYGALVATGGKATINWKLEDDETDPHLRL